MKGGSAPSTLNERWICAFDTVSHDAIRASGTWIS